MDDLAQQLQQLLNDPAQMAQLSSLAASLGFSEQDAKEAPAEQTPPPQADAPELDAFRRLLPLLQQSGGREAQVFGALRPFLSAEDQKRADRAVRAARLSRLTRAAMKDGALSGLLG